MSVFHWSKSRNSINPRCYFGGHLGFGIKMTPRHDFNIKNGFVALKLVGLEVLLKYLRYIGQNLGIFTNPRWPPDAILNYKKGFIENDRESSVLDSRHLQATFLKKSAF